jgi:hypothetical protein
MAELGAAVDIISGVVGIGSSLFGIFGGAPDYTRMLIYIIIVANVNFLICVFRIFRTNHKSASTIGTATAANHRFTHLYYCTYDCFYYQLRRLSKFGKTSIQVFFYFFIHLCCPFLIVKYAVWTITIC